MTDAADMATACVVAFIFIIVRAGRYAAKLRAV